MLVIILIVFSSWFVTENIKPHSCTIFTAVQGEMVLFGDNWDYHEGDLIIGYFPPSSAGYGSVHFGFRDGEKQFYQRAVNDHSLAWAVNSIPRAKLNPHPEKAFDYAEDEFLYTISKNAATVEEALRIAHNYDFGDSMVVQIHIADASGEAVVISPGSDGEIAFTHKPSGDGYLLSTNFNLATRKGPVDFRWETANTLLDKLSNSQTLTPDFAGEVLNAVHLENLTTQTLISNVVDLKNGDIYIYYISQFNEATKINIVEELDKGQRIVELRDLFSPKTAQVGDDVYQKFETRFMITIITVIVTGTGVTIGGLVWTT